MEIVLLTSVIVTLFLVFVITIWREMSKVSSPDYKPDMTRPTGGRYTVYNLLEDQFNDKPKKKKKLKKSEKKLVKRIGTISDMESNGVYFGD